MVVERVRGDWDLATVETIIGCKGWPYWVLEQGFTRKDASTALPWDEMAELFAFKCLKASLLSNTRVDTVFTSPLTISSETYFLSFT